MKRISTQILFFLLLFVTGISFAQSVPELLYYKFDGTGTIIPNLASNATAATDTAIIVGTITQGSDGQCGGALIGNNMTSTDHYVNTGWATNLDTSWTLSFWTSNIPSTTSTQYILGDVNAGSFRVFTGGVAGAGNWILRGGFTDVLATGGASANPTLTTFVYDEPAGQIRAYVNGTLVATVAQTPFTVVGTGPFKVGGYSASSNLPLNSVMDEFRLYSRALSATEIQSLLNLSSSSSINVAACGSYTVPSGDETYTASGVYNDTIPNTAGCDSIITVNLNILSSSTSNLNVTACGSYTVPSGDETYMVSGVYNDTIPNTAGCDSLLTINLTINMVDTNVTMSGITLTADATGATYQWIDCSTMQPIAGGTGATYVATANGNYAVIVTENSCSDTSDCYNITGVGMSGDEFSKMISLYPNPARNQVMITTAGQEKVFVEILNTFGQTLDAVVISGAQTMLDMNYAAGVYFVKFTSMNGERAMIRLIKE